MQIGGVSGFGNSMCLVFMIVGGAMVIPAGQTLFVRLFGQADDMHAGGGFLRSAFYGGRFASAMTFGLAWKTLKGTVRAGRHIAHKHKKDNKDSKYSDDGEDSAEAEDSSAYQESEGGNTE